MIDELDLKILKTLLTHNVHGLEFAYNLNASLFSPETKSFAKIVLDYIKSFKSVPTRRTLLDRHNGNVLRTNEINQIWDRIDSFEYDLNEYTYDLEKLKKRFQAITVNTLKDQLAKEQDIDPEATLKNVLLTVQQTNVIKAGRAYTQKIVGDYLEEFSDRYEGRKENPENKPSVQTGFSLIDYVTGGLVPTDLFIVGAESGAGKSFWLNNMAINMWLQTNTINTHPDNFAKGHNILYFSLEMPYEDCFIRFMSRLANVPQRELYSSTLTDEQSQRVARAHEFIKQYQKAGYYFGIVDIPRNATIEELELRYNDALLTYRPDIVVVDYLGLMHIHGFAGEADWLKQGAISASLHEFSRAYDIIMLTAAQLTDIKRGSTSDKSEETKRVGMHRMGRSSMIMHNVTLGVQIETRPSEMGYPDLRYHIIKNRRGPLGQGNLIKNFAHASLIDVPYVDAASGPADVDYEGLIKSIRDSHENTE
jgi:replicative DNA helicase